MDKFTPKRKSKKGPEAKIQEDLIKLLKCHDWLVKATHGNEFQSGFPDLFAAHKIYGQRWIEVKNAKAYRFTNAQMLWFPQFAAAGVGIWILTEATLHEIQKLHYPPNWHTFLKG